MSSYTERFTEAWQVLGVIAPASYSSEQNSGYVSCANVDRVAVIIHAAESAGTIDVDIEQATDTSGTSAKALDSGNKDMSILATESLEIAEIKGEEFDVANGFDCLNVEMTPAQARVCGCIILGRVKYPPASTTLIDAVTD